MQRLMREREQNSAAMQTLIMNNALALAAAQNIALLSQIGMTTLVIAANNSHSLIAASGSANLKALKF
jgi:hypothetical protein